MSSTAFEEEINNYHSDPSFEALEKIVANPLGNKILQTVAIQLEGGGSLASVSKLLNDLKSDLESKQLQADSSHNQFQTSCKKDVDKYTQRIQLAVAEINDSEFKVGRFESDIDDYTGELDLKASQISTFQQKDQTMRDQRTQQSSNYNKRSQQLKDMIQAFTVILPKLHEFYDQASAKVNLIILNFFNQLKIKESMTQSLLELSEIGGNNPITALVALSVSFDPISIQTIIEKMEGVRDSLIASVEQEERIELEAKKECDVTLNTIFNALEALGRQRAQDEDSLQECIRGRDLQMKRSIDADTEFQAAKKGLFQRRTQCQELLVQYQQNTLERSKQIETIKQVQNIIATKINVMQAFLQEYETE